MPATYDGRRKTNARADALRARFEAAGAAVVEPPLLQPAETLLDLYGEDIRARAYVTSDALRGEQMLRPDFTVPVVQMHMAVGAEPARYTYAGEVFRRQEEDPDRANEYVQVGYEVFDRTSPAEADAEVFALFADALAHLPLRAATGDIGLLMAAVGGLGTTDRRKAALMRHIWRPRRFRALLDRFSGKSPVPEARADAAGRTRPDGNCGALDRPSHAVGDRGADRRAPRRRRRWPDRRRGDRAASRLCWPSARPFRPRLATCATSPATCPRSPRPWTGWRRGPDAMSARGMNVETLDFEASYGRTSMEYYDGFVFGFYAEARPDLPPVATGGRYDALTRRLGQGAEIPAVGGVLRPDLMLELEDRP